MKLVVYKNVFKILFPGNFIAVKITADGSICGGAYLDNNFFTQIVQQM
jgi:hypothetical protein